LIQKFLLLGCVVFSVLHGPSAVAGVNDIKPSPILGLVNGISFELIDSVRAKQMPVETMLTVFSEEDQKHLPMRVDQYFTPLCAAAFMGSDESIGKKKLLAVKELIALGADVNAPCIDQKYILRPLELAYGSAGNQKKDTDLTRALKESGAEVSTAWKNFAFNDQVRTAYRSEESRRQAVENLRLLGSIAKQVIGNAVSSGMASDARTSGTLLVNAADGVSAPYQDELARRSDDPALVRMLESLRTTPADKNVHAFFQVESEGRAWCATLQPQQLVIDALKKSNARLENMIPCRCEKAPANIYSSMPFICGVMYADSPKNKR
jgi:hypothetical protein